MSTPFFSLLIPTKGGSRFLTKTLSTILGALTEHCELLVSSDRQDPLGAELARVRDKRLRVLESPDGMSMSEHWDWLQLRANGEWQMFLGQDDALQPYFERELVRLTGLAQRYETRAIVARRAFMMWEGIEDSYGNTRAQYLARSRVDLRHSNFDAVLAILNIRSYHHLPQAYTSSIVRADLLKEIRDKQGGKLFVGHPQDASLSASITQLEKTYLYSHIPISWVGTSSASAGLAISKIYSRSEASTSRDRSAIRFELADKYVDSVTRGGGPKYPSFAGDFRLGERSVYFWQAKACVASVTGYLKTLNLLLSRPVVLLVLSGVWSRTARKAPLAKKEAINTLAEIHSLSAWVPRAIGSLVRLPVLFVWGLRAGSRRLSSKLKSILSSASMPGNSFTVAADQMPELQITELSALSDAIYQSGSLGSRETEKQVKISLSPLPQ